MDNHLLTKAGHYFRAGLPNKAKDTIDELLAKEPGNTEAIVMKAMLHCQQNNFDKAEGLMRKALTICTDRPDYHCNLALILSKMSRRQDAISEYKHALNLNPDIPEAYYNLGILIREEKEYEQAIDALNKAIMLKPRFAAAYNALGNTYRDKGDIDNAIKNYKSAISLNSDLLNARAHLGFLLYRQGALNEAEKHLRHALVLNDHYPDLLYALGCLLIKQSRTTEAVEMLSIAIKLEPGNPDAFKQLGTTLRSLGQYDEAINTYKAALSVHPDYPDLLFGLGLTMQAIRDHNAAAGYFNRILAKDPDNVKALISFANSLKLTGKINEAINCCDKIFALDKDNVDAASLMSRIHAHSGNTEISFEYIKPYLNKGTGNANLLLAFADASTTLHRKKEAIGLLEDHLETRQDFSPNLVRTIYFALGKLHDAIGNFDRAFDCYSHANSLTSEAFGVIAHTETISSIIEVHNPDFIAKRPLSRQQSERPVFIVGMPRSGTSLVEQIVSGHSLIHGGGELLTITRMADNLQTTLQSSSPYPYCLPDLTPDTLDNLADKYLQILSSISADALRVTDKLPGNYLYLGLIEQLFPKARIIHCIRNPLDTCLSCYFTDFTGGHPYSYDLTNLGVYYKEYIRLMSHWKQTIKLPILEIHYEELVSNFEHNCRKLIEFCGVQWEPECMEFHNNKRLVLTASYDQVSQPLYTRSINRWMNYQDKIKTLIDTLGLHNG